MVSTNMGAIMSGVMVIGKIGSGLSSDYLGRANVTALVILISGLLCLALWLNAYTEPAVWAFGILFGMYQHPFFTSHILTCFFSFRYLWWWLYGYGASFISTSGGS